VNVPDSSVPIEGYRVWGVRDGLLESPTTGFCGGETLWIPYRAFEATCLALASCTDAPNPDHTCGVHAYRTLTNALVWARKVGRVRPVVVGTVRMWGTVVESAGGWRSQFAYPHTLYDGPGMKPLAATYGVGLDD
jgi:hypothetical protein